MEPEERAGTFHRDIDSRVAEALKGLSESGRKLPCGPGCSWCCHLPVRATAPEGRLVAAWLRSNISKDALPGLRHKIEGWLTWQREELPHCITGADISRAYVLHGPPCPFLKGGLCGIYPVRPMGCRVHFSYDVLRCGPEAPYPSIFDPPHLVQEALDAARPVCVEYRLDLEDLGLDFERDLRLLPELLADILC